MNELWKMHNEGGNDLVFAQPLLDSSTIHIVSRFGQ
jgi:hypothetical protein